MAEKKGEQEPEKKEKKEEKKCETAGGLRWLITYADMITLLLGVFIILCSSGGISESNFKAMATAFSRVFSIFEGGGERKIEKSKEGAIKAETRGYRIAGVSVFKQRFMEQIEHGFKDEKTLGLVRVLPTQDGIKISIQDRLFFKEKTSRIQVTSEKTLDRIERLLSSIENKVIIESHTDNIKPEEYPSNWELSSKRAIAIFENLTKNKSEDYKRRFQAKSFSDTKPAVPSNPSSPKNNRIDIVILE